MGQNVWGGHFPVIWGGKSRDKRNNEKKYTAAIARLPLMEIHNNQPKVGISNELEVGSKASLVMRVGWDVILSFGPSK
jgi:hypothetical protein